MKKITTLLTATLLCAATVANAADLYFDMNGTSTGFGVNGDIDPFEVNFTNSTWNTDSSGGAGGVLTTVDNGDILHFGLEGTNGVLFNWTYFTNATIGGIHTYQTAGATNASINRFQKQGGGFVKLQWAPGAAFQRSSSDHPSRTGRRAHGRLSG